MQAYWTDENGDSWPEPTIRGRLKFKIPLHRRLRDFVLKRDGYRCQRCGVQADPETRLVSRWDVLVADHIVSRRNGGRHHPDNMQALCWSCNSRKAGAVDAKGVAA